MKNHEYILLIKNYIHQTSTYALSYKKQLDEHEVLVEITYEVGI